MAVYISVIVCTHNPRRDYINKVIENLKIQTLPLEKWELLIVDNASEHLLSSEIDLSWHFFARHVREEKLGLTSARLKGIQESTAEILVFVDDDNVLEPDYLEVALQISKDYHFIGAWGGQVKLNFEVPPPNWTKRYWMYLGYRESQRDIWSNLLSFDSVWRWNMCSENRS
jgi:glycosyltransferase involved in cell wall biosynthesis